MRLPKLLFLVFLVLPVLLAQGTSNCQWSGSATTAVSSTAISNLPTTSGGAPGCVSFRLVYWTNATSGVSIQIEGSPDHVVSGVHTPTGIYTALTPAQGGGSGSGNTTNPATATPAGQINACCDYWPWLRVTVNTLTSSGAGTLIEWRVYGYQGTSAAAGKGGGGGNPSGPAGGDLAGSYPNPSVAGLDTVPFCSGYAPTNGQLVQYTTSSSPNPCYQSVPSPTGETLFYFTNTASDISTYLQATAAPYSPKTTLTFTGQSGTTTNTLQNWATVPGQPGVTFIPAGEYTCHLHALRTNAFAGSIKLQCQFVEVSALGVDIAVIGTSEPTVVLTQLEVEYQVSFPDGNTYTMASSASRIVARVQAVLTAVGTTSSVSIFVGGTADSHIELPASATSGGITQLTGDVTAGPGNGSVPATVVGFDGVPICSGFSPTNGQTLKYTTGGSPNPCYAAVTASGGTIASTTNALKGDAGGNAVAVTGTGSNCVHVDGTSAICASGGGGGGLVLLATLTASSSAELDFVTRNATGQSGAMFQSDYDEYQIEVVGIVTSTSSSLAIQFSTDGGSTYDTGANYAWQHGFIDGTNSGVEDNGADTGLELFFTSTATTANEAWQASLKLSSPLSTSLFKQMLGDIATPGGAIIGLHSNFGWAGMWKSTSAANAFRVIPTAGNLASGSIRVYGLAKS